MNATTDQTIDDAAAEEAKRAEWYGLLAELFYAPPQPALLEALRAAAGAQQPGADRSTDLAAAFQALLNVATHLSGSEIEVEYDALFGGVGKPEIFLFGSHYLSGFLNEKPLVQLRDDLAQLGLARVDHIHETEDHIACLCDAMRHLIGESDQGAEVATNLDRQQLLFERHIASWFDALTEALLRQPKANFYARLADLMHVFLSIERQAFEMLEPNSVPSRP